MNSNDKSILSNDRWHVNYVVVLVFFTIVIDTSFVKIFNFGLNELHPEHLDLIFVVISIICILFQFYFLHFVKSHTQLIFRKRTINFKFVFQIVYVFQSVLAITLVILLVQISFFSLYYTAILVFSMSISYIVGILCMALLAYSSLKWFKATRNLSVLIFGISSISMASNAAFNILYSDLLLINQAAIIKPHTGVITPYLPTGAFTNFISIGYSISLVSSFLVTWIACIVFSKQLSSKLGKLKYFIVLVMPSVYFIFQLQPFHSIVLPYFYNIDPLLFSIGYAFAFTLSKPVEGAIFAIIFLVIGRSTSVKLRSYTTILACGFILMFSANQANVVTATPFPPFGISGVCWFGLGSYLVLVGIYSSAVSVAQDSALRFTIQKSVKKEFDLLGGIGTGFWDNDVETKIVKIAISLGDKMKDETTIDYTLDIKDYVKQVIRETRTHSTE